MNLGLALFYAIMASNAVGAKNYYRVVISVNHLDEKNLVSEQSSNSSHINIGSIFFIRESNTIGVHFSTSELHCDCSE